MNKLHPPSKDKHSPCRIASQAHLSSARRMPLEPFAGFAHALSNATRATVSTVGNGRIRHVELARSTWSTPSWGLRLCNSGNATRSEALLPSGEASVQPIAGALA